MDCTKILSEFVFNLKYGDLDNKTKETTRLLIADYFSACIAGYRTNKVFNNAVLDLMDEIGGNEQSSILFSDKKLPASNSAFVNAVYAHGADMDDGNRKAMGHVGAHVIPSVLSLAETLDVTENEVLVAIIAGYEVYCRVAAAVQPGLVHRGFHSTGTAGAIACAAACAKLMGLDEEGIYNSMAIACTQASGLIIVAESGQSCKPINPARAAQTGIISAKLIKSGVKSFDIPLDSKKGWFHAMSEEVDYSMITSGLGETYCVNECYFKPYPSCRHTHCGLQAAKELYNEYKNKKIKKVNLFIYRNAIQIAGQIKHPATEDDCKFSIHYSLACMLSNGSFGLSDLTLDYSQEVNKMIDKIELIEDQSMENRDKGIRGSKISIETEDGEVYEKTVLIPKGDPENPFTIRDIKEKFDGCCDGVAEKDEIDKLIEKIMDFGGEEKYSPLTISKRSLK